MSEELRAHWLAGQIDEVEDGLIGALNDVRDALRENTAMGKKIIMAVMAAVLAAGMTLLTTVIIAGISGG